MLLETPSPYFVALAAPFVGSFLGVLATRLPYGRDAIFGRSACMSCHTQLRVADLIPILSWLAIRGRCRHCKAELSRLYPFMEIAALAVVLWAAAVTSGAAFIASVLLGWLLLTLAIIDWQTRTLPDALTLPLAALGLAATAALNVSPLWDHLAATAIGFLAFAGVSILYRLIRGHEGLGLGDAKLLAALGAWVSWQGLPSIVMLGCTTGLTVTLLRSARGNPIDMKERLPFGTFLALAGWLVWLYGPLIPY